MQPTYLAPAALLLLAAACSAPAASDAASAAAGETTGAGAVLQYTIDGGHPRLDVTASATDEYLRSGEAVTLSIGANQIFSIYDQTFWSEASIDGQARLTRGGAAIGTVPVSFASGFGANDDPLFRVATSAPLVIPPGADSVAFERRSTSRRIPSSA